MPRHFYAFFVLLFALSPYTASTQTQLESDILATTAVTKSATPISPFSTNTAADYYRHFKKLSSTYSGYLIELVRSDKPLRRDYPVFHYFGNVHYEVSKEGDFVYYIKGNQFKEKKNLNRFFNDVIIPQVPEAKIVVKKGL